MKEYNIVIESLNGKVMRVISGFKTYKKALKRVIEIERYNDKYYKGCVILCSIDEVITNKKGIK